MAKYILYSGGNGYCGCNFEDVIFYPNEATDEDFEEDGWAMAEDNAQTYSHIHFGWGEEYGDEEWEEYLDNHVEFGWEEITRERYLKWCKEMGYTPATEEEVRKEVGE